MPEYVYHNILALDTSTSTLKLAVSFGEDRLVTAAEPVERSHGQILVRKISNLFESAGVPVRALDALAIASGPGSFTGLRIGLAIAKGMAVALDVPVVGVSLFEAGAFVLRNAPEPVHIVMQVRRGEYLVATVNEGTVDLHNVAAVPEAHLAEFLGTHAVTSVGLDLNRLISGAKLVVPQLEITPADLLWVGRQKLHTEGPADLAKLEPLYFGKSQAEIRFEQRHGFPQE